MEPRTTRLTIVLPAEERRAIRAAAKGSGKTVSTYLLELIRQARAIECTR
jgi:uncharacterized protein (DUF1778 family)